jgi:hypothetical protein
VTEVPEIVKRARSLVPAIAADLSGFGGILRCTGECGRREELDRARIEACLRHGWPECCGHSMRWVTQRELDEEKRDG